MGRGQIKSVVMSSEVVKEGQAHITAFWPDWQKDAAVKVFGMYSPIISVAALDGRRPKSLCFCCDWQKDTVSRMCSLIIKGLAVLKG